MIIKWISINDFHEMSKVLMTVGVRYHIITQIFLPNYIIPRTFLVKLFLLNIN